MDDNFVDQFLGGFNGGVNDVFDDFDFGIDDLGINVDGLDVDAHGIFDVAEAAAIDDERRRHAELGRPIRAQLEYVNEGFMDRFGLNNRNPIRWAAFVQIIRNELNFNLNEHLDKARRNNFNPLTYISWFFEGDKLKGMK